MRTRNITPKQQGHFITLLEESICTHWDLDALSDYHGKTFKYRDVALHIAELHILFDKIGIRKGDKIAVCGRNSSHWGIVFLATITYGAVAVPILNDFKPDNIHNIVTHTESTLLFVGETVWENLDENMMPKVKGIIKIEDFSFLIVRSKKFFEIEKKKEMYFEQKYRNAFSSAQVSYNKDQLDELAYISYTSGTTSFSKGVMIPYRSMMSNIIFAQMNMPLIKGDNHVCMLPLAHAFGLMFSFIFEFTKGCHTYFLTRMPSPKIIFNAYAETKPNLIITVPLIVEKVVRKAVLPKLETPSMKFAMRIPVVEGFIFRKIRQKLIDLFGGNVLELVIGGAAMNDEVENILKRIHFPFTIGYGMTESGPLICYSSNAAFKKGSCGRVVDRMEIKIDSEDPQNIVGEIMVKGDNVMLGYYKNPDVTAQTLTNDGWMHTGDLGVIDSEGNLYIRGRSKNMLLSANGQNIYPEEIEDKLSFMPYVSECIVVQQNGKLVALIHPDYNSALADKLTTQAVDKLMDSNRIRLNEMLPKYSQVASVKICPEEFEKTPKRSIKRYLYT